MQEQWYVSALNERGLETIIYVAESMDEAAREADALRLAGHESVRISRAAK